MKKSESPHFITLGRILKPQGRRGEVAVELLTDFPEQFAQRRSLTAVSRSGQRRQLQLEDFWAPTSSARGGSPRLIMKFAGIDSISAAEEVIGCELQIPRSQRAALGPGAAYATDLIGCHVFATEGGAAAQPAELGVIDDVTFGAGVAPLLIIRNQSNRELMIPFAAAYIHELDIENQRLVLTLPGGMLSLDMPLTSEEKEDQRRKQ